MQTPELLRQARERAGMTAQQVADKAGTARSAVSAYEAGAKSPTAATLERLLGAMGVGLALEDRPTFRRVPYRGGRYLLVPDRLWRLSPHQALRTVELPLWVHWSRGGPAVYDLSDPGQRAIAYRHTMSNGTPEDMMSIIDGALLCDMWDTMHLPPYVRDAWQPLIDAAHGKAVQSG